MNARTHWTELPTATHVQPDPAERPEWFRLACPACLSTEWRSLKEWGYYQRTGIAACECGTKFVYQG